MARRALVVGLSQYPANIGSLEQPPIDAEKFAQIIKEHGEYAVERLPQRWNETTNKSKYRTKNEERGCELIQR